MLTFETAEVCTHGKIFINCLREMKMLADKAGARNVM